MESKEAESEQEETTKNKEEITTAYIAKIFRIYCPESRRCKWLECSKNAQSNPILSPKNYKRMQAFKNAFLQQFTNNNTFITFCNPFCNIKQEISETVMTYLKRFNKLLRQIRQLKTNNYYSDAQILDQFIAGLKDKLIKKVCPYASEDLTIAIKHGKNYKITMKEANHTKLVNLAIGKTSSALKAILQTNNNSSNNHKDINLHNNAIRTTLEHHPTTNLKIVITRDQQNRSNQHYSSPQQFYYQPPPPTYYPPRPQNQNSYYQPVPQPMQQQYQQSLPTQQYQTLPTQQYQIPARKLVQYNQFTSQNQFSNNNNRINPNNQLVPQNSGQQKPNYYYTQPTPRSNPSNNIILPVQIAQNANLSNIFSFKFEANELPFLLNNTTVNKQKTITAMYTKATIPVGEIDNFSFTINRIIISVKVLKLKISYQEQYTIVPATSPVFEFEKEKEIPLMKTYMAEKTEQEIFEESRGWKKVRAIQENVRQMKEAEYIEYTMELTGFDYENKCLECYALSILLPDKNDENEIKFGVSKLVEKLSTTFIYLFENQPPLQLKYFDNHGQGIRPEKAHEINIGYDLRYPEKDILVLQPKFLTKINLKIALKILPGAMVQIASKLSLANKGINIRGKVIDTKYTEDITIMLQNKTDKPFKIEHAEKIVQAIYLPLINISGL
ncbi:hypothetical protein G9A89_023800 [Geosiphon pyriformis]|nr:hypothetical protein G9A89_023800 [Geosiphon pyriformis]